MIHDKKEISGEKRVKGHVPEEDHNKGDNVEPRVEAESALRSHDDQHTWECQGKDESPAQTGSDSPGHTDLSMGKREDLKSKLVFVFWQKMADEVSLPLHCM